MDAFLGEIRAFGFDFVPEGWVACDGTVYSIGFNQALASLLGRTFGGDGVNNFGVPDLRARTPYGNGQSDYQKYCQYGLKDGSSVTTLSANQIPSHGHQATFTPTGTQPLSVTIAVANADGTQTSPQGGYLAKSESSSSVENYAPVGSLPSTQLAGTSITLSPAEATVAVTVAGQAIPVPVDLFPSHVAVRYFICCSGIYPVRE